MLLQCGAVITRSFFILNSSQEEPHSSPMRPKYRVCFVGSNSDFHCALVIAVIHAVSCYFESHHSYDSTQIARHVGPTLAQRGADRIHVGPTWGQRSLLSGQQSVFGKWDMMTCALKLFLFWWVTSSSKSLDCVTCLSVLGLLEVSTRGSSVYGPD